MADEIPDVPDMWWARHQGQNAVLVRDHGGVRPLLLFVNDLFELPADAVRLVPATALAGTTTPADEEAEFIEEALRCADAGDAGHWPTAAGYLADEVRRLRALFASTPTAEESTP